MRTINPDAMTWLNEQPHVFFDTPPCSPGDRFRLVVITEARDRFSAKGNCLMELIEEAHEDLWLSRLRRAHMEDAK